MKKTGIIRFISLFICFSLLFEQSGFAQVAGTLNLSAYLSAATSAPAVDKFRPLHLRYLSYDAQNNNFKLLLDKGDAFIKNEGRGTKDEGRLRDDTKTLLKYFLIGVSLPNDAFWVNLRPDSPDNVIDNELAFTDIGKILLEADVQLKKDTASYTSPTTPEGRIYWNKLYKKAEELFGYENITIPTLTRPWIVPGEIIIRESPEGAYIYKATLKVMLEEDYLRKTKDEGRGTIDYSFKDPRMKALNEYSTQLIKELIIPKITREVNTSKKYASLRQVYYSLILAQWFKTRHASSLQGASTAGNPSLRGRAASEAIPNLINSHNLLGLASKELWSKNTYFDQYQKSFKNGEYNIQEPVQTPYGQTVRSYFSGGADLNLGPMPVQGSTIRNPRGGCIISIAAATDRIIELSRRVKKYIVAMRSRGNPDNVEVETEGVASMGGTDQPSLSAGQLFRSEFGKAANNVMKFLNLNASNINRIIEYKKIFKQDSYLRVVYEYTITFDSGVQKVFYTKMAVIGAEDRAKIEKEGLISAVVFDIGLGPKTQIIQIKGEPVLISMPAEGQPINVAEALDADTTRALGFALGRLRGAGIIHGDFVSGWFDGVFRPDHIYVARIDNEIRVNFIDFSEGKMNDFDFENNLEKNLISSFVRLSLPIVFEQAYELGLHSLPAAAARLQTMMQISLATQVQARQLIDELNNPNSRAEIAIELLRRILGYYEMYGGHSENQRGNACTLTVFYVITRYIVRRLDITEFRAARLIGGIDFQVPGNLNKSEPIKILGVEIGTLDMEEGSPLNPSGKAEKVIENVNLNEEVMEQLLLALQAKITSAMPSQGLSIPPAASAAQVRTPAAGGVVQKLRAFWRDEEGSVKLPGERAAEDAAKARQIQAPGAESSDADITREIQPVSLPLKNDSLHFVVADQTRPPQLDRSKTISVSWVDMHNLVPGTLIHYKIAKGHWDYTLRIESDNMVSIWLRDEHGRALGSIDKLQSMNIISGGLNFTDGILDVSQSVAMPYFEQTPWKDGERLLLSVSVGGVSFAATPQDIIIQVPAGEILPVGAARLSATSDNAGLFQASPAAAAVQPDTSAEDSAPKGSPLQCLRTIVYDEELKEKTDISVSADLQPKRINYRPGKSSGFSEPKAYSSSAVYEEVRILKALGLLVANPDPAKPHTYQLSEEIRNLPWYHRNAFFRSIFYSQEITRSLNRFTILEDEIARIRQQIEALLRRAQERAAEDIAEEAMLDSLERDFETRFVRNAAMLSKDYVSDEGTEIGLAERRFGRGVYELIEKTKSLSTMARIISIYERVGEEWFKQAGDQFVRAYKDNYAKAVYKLRQLEIDDLLSFIIFWDPSLQGKQEQIRNALEDDLEDSIALRNTLLNLGMAQEEITRHILPYMHRTAGVQRLLQVARFTTNSSLGAPGVEIRRNYNNFEAMESDLLNRQIQQENRIPQMYDWAMIGLLRAHIMDHFGVYIEIPFGSTQIQDGNDQLIEGYPGTEETASPEVLLKIYNSLKEIEKALLNVQANRKQLVGMNFNLRKFVLAPQGRACYSAREGFVFIRPVRADTPNALHVLYHEIGHGVLLCEWGSVPFWVPKTGLEEFMGRFGFEALRAKVGSAEGRRNVAFEILWQIFESRLEKYREMSTTSVVRSEALRKNNFATSLSLEYMLEVPEYDLSRYPHAPWGGKRKLQ